jgi:purine-binding chemotaxis protein CheW
MSKSRCDENDSNDVMQWLTFKLGNETYGINVMHVQEVLRYTEIASVPGAPYYVLGLINLRGSFVTLIDTRSRFDLPTIENTEHSRIVVITSEKQVVGILVDSVAEVVYLKESEIDEMPKAGKTQNAKFIQGLSHRDGKLLSLVDLEQLLLDDEWEALKSF